MAFVDEITLTIRSGKGGDGVVRWLHEHGKEFGGPAGGDGGRGGDVYVVAVRDINKLSQYKHNTNFTAEDGEDGRKKSMYGKDGEDLTIPLPVGSVVTNKSSGETFELLKEGEERKILSGGAGGLGNIHFKSSRNTRPKKCTPGKPGEEAEFYIELSLIADAGFIGLPNVGKSSLLNALTHARAKVGNYQFTTLDPNLGDFFGFILADIPGLIHGASQGKGLGHKFLRHISRTRMLIHCISAESSDPINDYTTIREELRFHDEAISHKKEIIVITKSDMVSGEDLSKIEEVFIQEVGMKPYVVSIIDDTLLKSFKDSLTKLLST